MKLSSLDIERAPWLAAEDRALRHEIRQLLAQLLTVSEARALRIATPTSHSKPDGSDPGSDPGAVPRNKDGCPKPGFSLWEHYRWRFAHAKSDLHRRVILAQGRVALRERQHGLPAHKIAKGGENPLPSEVAAEERQNAKWLVEDAEGVHAAEIAADTGWPIGWVCATRERAGRDPEYGHERPRWRELDEQDRVRLVANLKASGLDQRGVATAIGVSKTTVAKYWPAHRRHAA